ncbi:MAG: hypothetical protein ACLRQF_01995 [Thomasclavelia ramosa]
MLCFKSKDYLDLIQEDGAFGDVDYKVTSSAANGTAWSPYLALRSSTSNYSCLS